VAATAAAREHAARERSQGGIRRRYVAIAAAAPSSTRGSWQTPVGDRAALTRFACIETLGSGPALLALEPDTGRKHQLRIHASRAGSPLLGDDTYGGPRKRVLVSGSVLEFRRVLLHAASLTLRDSRGERWRIEAPVAGELLNAWEKLGGSAEPWLEALRENLFGDRREP
jgi:23S rRNA-/tRNA-specific pseudouridylate synthase